MYLLQIYFIKGFSSANLTCNLELEYELHTHIYV